MICYICNRLIDPVDHETIAVTLTPNSRFASPYAQQLWAHYGCFKRTVHSSIPIMNPNDDGQ